MKSSARSRHAGQFRGCAVPRSTSSINEYPFQQLFTAVAEACGLEKKTAATGNKLPKLEMDEDQEDVEEDCEEASQLDADA